MQHNPPVCLGCTHFRGLNEAAEPVCAAFPDRIPDEIWRAQDPHIESRAGEPTYRPSSVAHLSVFVLNWLVRGLNPDLEDAWQEVSSQLVAAQRARERA